MDVEIGIEPSFIRSPCIYGGTMPRNDDDEDALGIALSDCGVNRNELVSLMS